MGKFDMRKWRLRKLRIENLNERTLLINVLMTQTFILLLALLLFLFLQTHKWSTLFSLESGLLIAIWGISLAAIVIGLDYFLQIIWPAQMADDGGMNKMLFASRPYWQIFILSFVVAFCEELLFRGMIQHHIGLFWTSVLFTVAHVRYLRQWILMIFVFITSMGLGGVLVWTGSLWTPILAHCMINLAGGCFIRYNHRKSIKTKG